MTLLLNIVHLSQKPTGIEDGGNSRISPWSGQTDQCCPILRPPPRPILNQKSENCVGVARNYGQIDAANANFIYRNDSNVGAGMTIILGAIGTFRR